MKKLIAIITFGFTLGVGMLAAFAQNYTLGDLTIENPSASATLPGAPVSGGYMIIRNTGTDADRLVSVSSEFAGKSEIHEMAMESGVMKMRHLPDGLEIPAGGEAILKPGGYHIMFMKLNGPLGEGEKRKVILTFENSGTIEVEFDVRNLVAIKKSEQTN